MSAAQIPIQIINRSGEACMVTITAPGYTSGPIGAPVSPPPTGTNVPGPNTYTATVTGPPSSKILGKKANCNVIEDPNIVWRIILDSNGVSFGGHAKS